MLGLLLIYFIGKNFYELAGNHNKNEWGYTILGIAAYYVGTFIGGLVIGGYYAYTSHESLEGMSDIVLGLIALPFGGLTCWGLYKVLQKQWEKISLDTNPDLLDDNLLT